jgi:hypothetical protein
MNPILWNRMSRAQRRRVRAVREIERCAFDVQLLLELPRKTVAVGEAR